MPDVYRRQAAFERAKNNVKDSGLPRIEALKSHDVARYMAAYNKMMEKWPVAYEEFDIPTGLGLTHVVASGPRNARPLFLLHAFLATATVWRPNVEGLSHHFRVYAIDVVGQGGRSVASRKIKARSDYAEWLCDVMDVLGIARTSIVGNSYGGFLAASQASLTPDRIERVVLISPAGVFVSFLTLSRMCRMTLVAIREGVARLWRKPRPRDVTSYLGKNVRLNPGDEDWIALGNVVASGAVRPSGFFPGVFSDAELRAIRPPTLLLIGGDEILYEPHAALKHARERMPSLEAHLVPNAHHLAAMAQPEEVNAMIIEFLLRKHDRSADAIAMPQRISANKEI